MTAMPELNVFFDFNCVWCYFNKSVVMRLKHDYDINLVWRAFPLHPDIPEKGESIAALFGNDLALMNDKLRQLKNKAMALGLPLKERSVISNSRLSQELGKWAETKSKTEAYHQAVYKAYFADGLDIGDKAVLLDIAEATRLPGKEAQAVLETRSFRQAVDDDWALSQAGSIVTAPTYVLNEKRLFGAQPYEELEKLIQNQGVRKKKQEPAR